MKDIQRFVYHEVGTSAPYQISLAVSFMPLSRTVRTPLDVYRLTVRPVHRVLTLDFTDRVSNTMFGIHDVSHVLP